MINKQIQTARYYLLKDKQYVDYMAIAINNNICYYPIVIITYDNHENQSFIYHIHVN